MRFLDRNWIYQFICCKYAILVSIDYRCGNGHLVHFKTLSFDPARIVWC